MVNFLSYSRGLMSGEGVSLKGEGSNLRGRGLT